MKCVSSLANQLTRPGNKQITRFLKNFFTVCSSHSSQTETNAYFVRLSKKVFITVQYNLYKEQIYSLYDSVALTQIVIHEWSNSKLKNKERARFNIQTKINTQYTLSSSTILFLTMSFLSTLVPTIFSRISSSCWITMSFKKRGIL